MTKPEENFEKLFIEAVDEGLETLGQSGKHMIFFHLDKSYSLKKREIPKKPEVFAKGLEKIFGAGSTVLKKIIVKSLCSKLELNYEDIEGRSFAGSVKHVKEIHTNICMNACMQKKQEKTTFPSSPSRIGDVQK